jgi:predicted small lipoprotein YifL
MIPPTNRTSSMPRLSLLAPVTVLALALALPGCGRKGSLEPPGASDAPGSTPSLFGTGAPAAPPRAPAPVPDQPFVLDPII